MSDETSCTYQKCVDDDGHNSHRFFIHINSESLKNALEIMSTFLWVMMIVWIEIGAILIFCYIFVSKFHLTTESLIKNDTNRYIAVFWENYFAFGMRLTCTMTAKLRKMAAEVKAIISFEVSLGINILQIIFL
jgi:hypothetical protein